MYFRASVTLTYGLVPTKLPISHWLSTHSATFLPCRPPPLPFGWLSNVCWVHHFSIYAVSIIDQLPTAICQLFLYFPFIVNGGFTTWSNWTECSASCGGGVSSRTRTCTNPIPMFGGASCADKPVETKDCNAQPCPPPKGKLRTRLSLPSSLPSAMRSLVQPQRVSSGHAFGYLLV